MVSAFYLFIIYTWRFLILMMYERKLLTAMNFKYLVIRLLVCYFFFIEAMYEDVSTKVRMNGRENRAFNVKVGVYQGLSSQPTAIHYDARGFV